jgi:hypothetical protein
MQLAEFIVKVALTGAVGVGKGLKLIGAGLKEVGNVSTETKTAVAGAVYGLYRLTDRAGAEGMRLIKFAEAFDLPIQGLQKWELMMRNFGAESEVQPVLQGIVGAMNDIMMNRGAPAWMQRMEIFPEKGETALDVLGRVQEKVKKLGGSMSMALLEGSPFNSNMIQAMVQLDQLRDKPDKGMALTDGQAKALARLNVAWEKFWKRLDRFVDVFVAKYGSSIVGVLNETLTILNESVNVLAKMAKHSDAMKLAFGMIGAVIASSFGKASVLGVTLATIVFALSEIKKFRAGEETVTGGAVKEVGRAFSPNLTKQEQENLKNQYGMYGGQGTGISDMVGTFFTWMGDKLASSGAISGDRGMYVPNMPTMIQSQAGSTTTINQYHINGLEVSNSLSDKEKYDLAQLAGKIKRGGGR